MSIYVILLCCMFMTVVLNCDINNKSCNIKKKQKNKKKTQLRR